MVNPLLIVGGGAALLYFLFRNSGGGDVLPTPVPTPTPKVDPEGPVNGTYPDAVITLGEAQKILVCKDVMSAKTKSGKSSADGIYGDQTAAALKAYQTAGGLDPNGFLDKATSVALTGETCPAAKADWADIGTMMGVNDGFSTRGGNYQPAARCKDAGALTSEWLDAEKTVHACDPAYLNAYAKGFGAGTYDAGYREGVSVGQSWPREIESAPLSSPIAVPAYVAAFKKGQIEGFAMGQHLAAADGTEDGSDLDEDGMEVSGHARSRRSVVRGRAAARGAGASRVGLSLASNISATLATGLREAPAFKGFNYAINTLGRKAGDLYQQTASYTDSNNVRWNITFSTNASTGPLYKARPANLPVPAYNVQLTARSQGEIVAQINTFAASMRGSFGMYDGIS